MLKTDYDYFAWNSINGTGRLKRIQTGTPGNPISLQSFEYDYDPAGNIDWIKNYNPGGTQMPTFHYDTMQRL